MTERFRFDVTSSRVNDSNLLVLARRHQLRPVPVKARAKHDVGMAVHVKQHLAGAHVPNHHLVVRSGCQQYVQGRRMPQHETNATLMIQQVDDRLGEGAR